MVCPDVRESLGPSCENNTTHTSFPKKAHTLFWLTCLPRTEAYAKAQAKVAAAVAWVKLLIQTVELGASPGQTMHRATIADKLARLCELVASMLANIGLQLVHKELLNAPEAWKYETLAAIADATEKNAEHPVEVPAHVIHAPVSESV